MTTKVVCTFFCFFLFVVTVLAGLCFPTNTSSSPAPHGNRYCAQYNSDTCCAQQSFFAQVVCTCNDGCDTSQGCIDLFNLVQCGIQCKPNFYQNYVIFSGNTSTVQVCSSLYNNIINACSRSQYCPLNSVGQYQNCFDNPQLCTNQFANNAQIFQTFFPNFTNVNNAGSSYCFAAAEVLLPSGVVVTLLALVALAIEFLL
jgi:hypothetical protein